MGNDNNTTTTITTATSTTNNERTKRRYSNTKETDLLNNNVNSSDSGLNNVVNTLRNTFNSSKLFMFRPCSIGTTSCVDVNNNNNDDDTSITHSGIYNNNNDGDDDDRTIYSGSWTTAESFIFNNNSNNSLCRNGSSTNVTIKNLMENDEEEEEEMHHYYQQQQQKNLEMINELNEKVNDLQHDLHNANFVINKQEDEIRMLRKLLLNEKQERKMEKVYDNNSIDDTDRNSNDVLKYSSNDLSLDKKVEASTL